MHWLKGGFGHLQLDIVGFLAILGEACVKANAQVSFLSPFCLLPRLLPAPQALIRTSRPESLKPDAGKVIGTRSGGIRDYINHIAHLVHSRPEPLAAYAVRCETISKPDPQRRVSASLWGPLAWLELLGTGMSVALLGLAVGRKDGFALMATVLLSLLSTIIGLGSRWDLILMQRTEKRQVPQDHIVIKYPNGAFSIVKCDENIARELYWHPEECNYRFGDTTYRIVSLCGTMMLMFGVICLGNSTLTLQIAFAAAYMVLNAAYWVVAALPQSWHWDLTCYQVKEEKYQGGEKNRNFTQALWKAIAITGSADWVRNGQVAPVTEAWKEWVNAAEAVVLEQKAEPTEEPRGYMGKAGETIGLRSLPVWDPEQKLTEILNPDRAAMNV